MNTLHLFAGAGGGILADLINGHNPKYAVEWDKYTCAVLRERFPGLCVIEGDVREVDFHSMVGIDAICGGFPCQDISSAGGGVGIEGERSGLFREVMRAIDVIRPTWVFLENSPRIRTKGRHVVIGELVARGYSWRDGILGASDVGAPHKRDRWWCLAKRTDTNVLRLNDGYKSGELGEETGADDRKARSKWENGHSVEDICSEMANANSEGLQEREGGTERERHKDQQDGREGALHMPCRNGFSSPGLEGYWDFEPGMGRVANGVANRSHRIKAIGNGQVPLCAASAWRFLGGPYEPRSAT